MKGGCTSELAQQVKSVYTEEEKLQHEKEYAELLALYIALLKNWTSSQREETLFALMELRAEYAIGHLLEGLGIDMDEAISLLENMEDDSVTQHDKDMRDRLYVGITNLIDFAVCEEYQLYDDTLELHGEETDIDFMSDEYDALVGLCRRYNDIYATVEDADIKYAGIMAAFWMGLSSKDWLVYWTQNDIKVRPWHMALQGYAAPAEEFPSWMIPPIEYNCRCFLERIDGAYAQGDLHKVVGSAKEVKKPSEISGVYDESLAKCGRIFGPAHDYFNVKEKDKEMLNGFVAKLCTKYSING